MTVMPDELDTKVKYVFGDVAVNKSLTYLQDIARLPRFISEYLLMKFCGDNSSQEKLLKLITFIRKHYPEPKDKDRILHELMTEGKYILIDEFKVETDIKLALHRVHIPSLNIYDAMIAPSLLEKYENLLSVGMWGLGVLEYHPEAVPTDKQGRPLASPVVLVDFTPFQAAKIDLDEFMEKRRKFTTEEWIDLLINTIGLNPQVYSKRKKLLLISRLIPLVEPNVNMMEFGPRATGKTYLYRHISYYTRIFSGGMVSPAVLFWNIARKTPGEIAMRDVVVFDEISKVRFSNPDEMMGKLKDYMESGHFERGPKKGVSTCSLVFMGNVDVEGEVPVEDFTLTLPKFMRDSAFIDRIHGLLPGWELPKIMKSEIHLSKHYGLATDYFCEIMHELRKIDFQHIVREHVELGPDVTIRDEKAILRLASGLLKLLFPHGEFSREELTMCVELAVEYRQRIVDWLHFLAPGEFKKKRIGYKIRM